MDSQRNYSLLRKAFGEISNNFGKPLVMKPPSLFEKIKVPILKPTFVTTTLKKLPNLIRKTTQKVVNWLKWSKNADKVFEKPTEEPTEVIEPQTEATFAQKEKALRGFTRSYEISLINRQDPLIQLQNTRLLIKNNLLKVLKEMKGLKFNEVLKITFEKQKGNELIEEKPYFNTKKLTLTNEVEITNFLETTQQEIVNKIDRWISKGSAWIIKSVDGHFINVAKYRPLKGSTYIPLPEELRHPAKGIINIKNNDDECFRWCHIRHLLPQNKDPQRIKKCDKKYVEKLDYSGIEFPVSVKQYNKIEKQNNIRVNVFGYEEKQKYPIYLSKEKFNCCLNLLLITEGEKKHYCLLKNFNKFMHNQTNHNGRKHFCMHCLQGFSSERVLINHKVDCIEINGKQSIKMPTPGSTITFKNYRKQLPAPFVIYADFEAITEKVSQKKSHTEQYQKHTACGYGYKVVCCYDDKFSKPTKIYRGEMTIHKFIKDMLDEVKYCKKIAKDHFTNLSK